VKILGIHTKKDSMRKPPPKFPPPINQIYTQKI